MSPPSESIVGPTPWGNVELPHPLEPRPEISHVLFDFDGTLSLIRQGWPEVMVPMFVEVLPRQPGETEEMLREMVLDDIMRLNGKQTIYQMIQLAERIRERGGEPNEPLWYKHEYLRRLDHHIGARTAGLAGAHHRARRAARPRRPAVAGAPARARAARLPRQRHRRVRCQARGRSARHHSLFRRPHLRGPGRLQAVLQEDGDRPHPPRAWDHRPATALVRRRLRRDREHQAGRRPGRRRRQRRGPQRLRPGGPVEDDNASWASVPTPSSPTSAMRSRLSITCSAVEGRPRDRPATRPDQAEDPPAGQRAKA